MELVKLVPSSHKQGRWLAQLADGSVLQVGEHEMADFALYAGMDLDGETLARLRQAARLSDAKQKALSLLSARPLSAGELEAKLRTKGAGEQEAGQVVRWAEELSLLNDAEYAKTIVRHYSAKGYGFYKIKDELYRRKIPKELWDTALSELPDSAEAIDRYLAGHLTSKDPKAVKKTADALLRRGFHWEEIAQGIDRCFGAWND